MAVANATGGCSNDTGESDRNPAPSDVGHDASPAEPGDSPAPNTGQSASTMPAVDAASGIGGSGADAEPVPSPGASGTVGGPDETMAGGAGPLPPTPSAGDAGEPEPIEALDAGLGCTTADGCAPSAGEADVALVFLFDVSSSMGSLIAPYYRRDLKWDPVVAATKAFFEDPSSEGVVAAMTFFPNEYAPLVSSGGVTPSGNAFAGVCEAPEYANFDVDLTALPSSAFSLAIDAITPSSEEEWRLSTPTLPALQGTMSAIDALRAAEPNLSVALVIVTDGEPALCDANTDSPSAVEQAIGEYAESTPTYVIGVANPVTDEEPNPPDNVSALNAWAVAGGTEQLLLVDTGNPSETTEQLLALIEQIRNERRAATP